MRLIDEIAYQYKIAKIPMEERTFVKAWETAQDMPTIDAAPVVRGEWVYSRMQSELAVSKCSNCGKEQFSISHVVAVGNYCPNCGAKMGSEGST